VTGLIVVRVATVFMAPRQISRLPFIGA